MHSHLLLEFILHKEFNSKERPSKGFVGSQKIKAGLVFGLPIEFMIKQLKIVKRQNKIEVVFTPLGVFGSENEIQRLLKCFEKSTQSN
jgi:hypothetical protein